ncbi:NosD domain-containing protein [Methanolobus sp. ZRKC3]|uniref:NosD domain-containing protein n=1 Tax=Methanolobus sp. ZRKC3 TaxID=3125786 RepID=UPI0032439B05
MRIKPYFAIAFCLMIMMSSTVSAATITVDDSGGKDYTTIQAAINAANDTDTILVYPGTYVENVDVNKSVTIKSQTGNPDDTVVQGVVPAEHVFNVTKDNVTISGFNATALIFGAGIYLDGVANCTVTNNRVYGWQAIYLWESSNNTLENNTIPNSFYGIFLWYSNNNTLNNNIVLKGANGIRFDSSINNTLDNNTATNSLFGIRFENASYNMLINNTVNSNNENGIHLSGSNNNTLINNTVCNSPLSGIVLEAGIYPSVSSNNMLIDNIVCNNTLSGIVLEAGSNNNTIYNNFFNNTNNTQIEGTSTGNVWNTTKTAGTNIVGGPFLGGNYWATPSGTGHSQTCTDTNNDGFCDSHFDIDASNTDYLPLTINASIDIEKSTNGFDEDTDTLPGIAIGDVVIWKYIVTNTGNVPLDNIVLIDDRQGIIPCPKNTLSPGESMECEMEGVAEYGHHINVANVTGQFGDLFAGDEDVGEYYGYEPGDSDWEPPVVPTANPFLTVGVLGIALVLFLRREQE